MKTARVRNNIFQLHFFLARLLHTDNTTITYYHSKHVQEVFEVTAAPL